MKTAQTKKPTQLDRIEDAIKRQDAKLDRILRAIKHHDLKADGALEIEYPWSNFDRSRRVQVEAVLEYLKDRASEGPEVNTIQRACRETWTLIRNGYPNWQALRSYCYSLPITDFM